MPHHGWLWNVSHLWHCEHTIQNARHILSVDLVIIRASEVRGSKPWRHDRSCYHQVPLAAQSNSMSQSRPWPHESADIVIGREKHQKKAHIKDKKENPIAPLVRPFRWLLCATSQWSSHSTEVDGWEAAHIWDVPQLQLLIPGPSLALHPEYSYPWPRSTHFSLLAWK